jgi:SEC-C motif-containing protein
MTDNQLCPCGSGKTYAECCLPILNRTQLAESPEALMRSRYAAYAVHDISWLRDSLEEASRKDFDERGAAPWSNGAEWMGLEIKSAKTDESAGKGFVEFVAKFKQQGVTREHHEMAEFRRVKDEWFFHDGRPILPATVHKTTPSVGRNDPCPCGSGKKYKKCCGK